MYFVYILKCEDDTLYTGLTNDFKKRFTAHLKGKGAVYTRNHRPIECVYLEEVKTRSDAAKREIQIKKFKRSEKLNLISSFVNSTKVI